MEAPVKQNIQARSGWLLRFATFCLACAGPVHAAAGTGFLVVAPERGFLGNQEIRAVFEDFKATYAPASLIFVGRDYTGIGSAYSEYVDHALNELREAGAGDLKDGAILGAAAVRSPLLQQRRRRPD